MATNSERSFNEALCRVLWTKHPSWRARMAAERHRAVKGGGTPDLIVRDPLAAPVVLETEYLPARTVEEDAVARLGVSLTDSGAVVEQSIAVRVPGALQTAPQPDLQAGRSNLTISRLPNLPALDSRAMSDTQHARAQGIFEDFRTRPFLPANEAYRDPTRQALDEAVLVELLGLPRTVLDPLALLRTQWCGEPTVHGGKATRP